jgi:hypothetical protein
MELKEFLIDALRSPIARSAGVISARTNEELRAEETRAKAIAKVEAFLKRELSADEVDMGGADVCNNVIDSYDSRFSEKSLRQIAKLMPGSGMTVGHDMSGWSYATCFDASVHQPPEGARGIPIANERGLRELRDMNLATWVRSKFYWPTAASWAKDLSTRIAYQITREVSAHWAFDLAVCGVCEQDLRACEHFPGDEYEGKKAWYQMEDVTDYVETGFVVKGGQYGTSTYPLAGRSLIPFDVAIREVKSSRKSWDAWRAEISDVLKATDDRRERRSRFAREGEDGLADTREFFARGLKRAVSV